MSWTAPKTWEDNELVTADLLNTHLRDNLEFLHDDFPPKRAWMWHANSLVISGNALTLQRKQQPTLQLFVPSGLCGQWG